MRSYRYNPKKKIAFFIVLTLLILGLLTFLKIMLSNYTTEKASQITLAQQYIAMAQSIASGMDKIAYEKVLASRQYDRDFDSIKHYLEEYRTRINALYVYTLELDETDVAKVMVAAMSPNVNDHMIGVPCTVPPKQVNQAKNGLSYYTNVINDPTHGLYISVGVPFYSAAGKMLGVVAIDVDVNHLKEIGHEVVNSNRLILVVDILFVVLLLGVVFTVHSWYRVSLKHDLTESETMYISEMSKILQSIKAGRHDLMNHLQVMRGLMDMRMYDRANEYLKQFSSDTRMLDLSTRIKNPVLMVLFQTKWQQAHIKNIELQFEIDSDDFSRVASMDIVKIYSNLLDNAIEAVEAYKGDHPRCIRVVCKTVGSHYMFAVENPALISMKDQKYLFQRNYTTKSTEAVLRGNGLMIIKRTVDKYEGHIHFQYENEKVLIQITI
ncbi:sensor kinase SpoOB-type protein [Paenibacillus cellulosilyticus]|uniref:Sensor kinase SpoOB-type protein n=1 Tax=Paenibacillus cellulosilyticus TaxID=375489 RepID=A0A2V2YGJ2_9BACL|nr:GHKL domain-containing protein [Paenibacillus cellulosilyticus]PWV92002.1 sensor kinase SpoOB-type protein [Paenibacillus cellulosilyticus]QKS46643.1 GHKL domain-containing protein [Paenibacillus cellulosilyticus]